MKLSEVIGTDVAVKLAIASVETQMSEKNERITILHLSTPLPVVTGSQTVKDEASGETERVVAHDVDTVKLHQTDEAAADEGFNLDENGAGTYEGNLRLDVAKSTGEVWLRTESFLQAGRKKVSENKQKANNDVLNRLRNRPTVTVKEG